MTKTQTDHLLQMIRFLRFWCFFLNFCQQTEFFIFSFNVCEFVNRTRLASLRSQRLPTSVVEAVCLNNVFVLTLGDDKFLVALLCLSQ